jgi:hypothetical protein
MGRSATWTRRGFLQRGAAAVLALAGVPRLVPGQADDKLPEGGAAKDMITPAAQEAINEGLAFLANKQHGNGSFGTGSYEGNVAITSLGALAMMAGGHQPGRGAYGKVVRNALEYVLNQEQKAPRGYLVHNPDLVRPPVRQWRPDHGPMYGHGFGTLFLAEVSGMVHDQELRERLNATLKRAVQLIIDSQNKNPHGGWRYYPDSHDADISVTICQIMALRAARNAGISVPKTVADRCTAYVKECQKPNGDGSFNYMNAARGPGTVAFARTAAGVVALNSAGIYKGKEVENGLKYLVKWKRDQATNPSLRTHNDMQYFYGHYYAVQAMWTAGGSKWAEWFPYIREELVGQCRREPGQAPWFDQICSHYGTAMACIILQVPNNYLPILQK